MNINPVAYNLFQVWYRLWIERYHHNDLNIVHLRKLTL